MIMKEFEVFIYDEESGCCQPIRCKARTSAEAGSFGNNYIAAWNLVGGVVTNIREVVS